MSKVKSKDIERKENNITRPIYFITFIVMIILLSIAYASLAVNLGVKINGTKKVEDLNWDIRFHNLKVLDGSVTPISPAKIDETETKVTYEISLKDPGDYYIFNVDIVNRGTIDAKIHEIIDQGISERQKKYLEYSVLYEDGTPIKIDDTLLKGETKTVTVVVRFLEDLNAEDLPKSAEKLDLLYQIIYVEYAGK